MVPMWVRYTTLHGPTSFDEDGHWLGQELQLLGQHDGPRDAADRRSGLYGHRTLLAGHGGRSARIGYRLTMIGLGRPRGGSTSPFETSFRPSSCPSRRSG